MRAFVFSASCVVLLMGMTSCSPKPTPTPSPAEANVAWQDIPVMAQLGDSLQAPFSGRWSIAFNLRNKNVEMAQSLSGILQFSSSTDFDFKGTQSFQKGGMLAGRELYCHFAHNKDSLLHRLSKDEHDERPLEAIPVAELPDSVFTQFRWSHLTAHVLDVHQSMTRLLDGFLWSQPSAGKMHYVGVAQQHLRDSFEEENIKPLPGRAELKIQEGEELRYEIQIYSQAGELIFEQSLAPLAPQEQ